MNVVVLIGTDKGAWLLRSDASRKDWKLEGPLFKGWAVSAACRTNKGTYLLGTGSMVYGASIQRSRDLSEWKQVDVPPTYPEGGKRKLEQIWRITSFDGACFAGVAEAGLFRSTDDGETWEPVKSLNEHETSDRWFPGKGGLCLHAILVDPKNPQRMWCGISAVGVFRSDDGGKTWTPKNEGVPVILEDKDHPGIGFCVHALVADPDNADVIYRQDHRGMFRTRDGGDHWQRIENGLISGYGFPLVMDRRTRTLFAVPLESDEYRVFKNGVPQVYRSGNGGDSWEPVTKGLPVQDDYGIVLRGAMDADQLEPCGVYFGTTLGDVYVSNNRGDSWQHIPCKLPRIHCVTAFVDA